MFNNAFSVEVSIGPTEVPVLLQMGLLLTLFDTLLAIMVSVYERRLSSALGYRGLVQKLSFYIVFLFLYMLVRWKLHENEWVSFIFFNGVLLCVILFELSSLRQHLVRIGIPEQYLAWIPKDKKPNKEGSDAQ